MNCHHRPAPHIAHDVEPDRKAISE